MKKELIRSATQSIECSFNFAGGEKLREFLSIIDERMSLHKDLKVHLMVSRDLLESEDFTMLEEYKKKYPDRFHYLITDRLTVLTPFIRTEENHVKLLVVDGKYFALGGSGVQANMTREKPPEDDDSVKTFAEYFIERSFKDTDLFGKASADKEKNVAACMRGQFYNLYQIWAKRMGVDLCEGEGVKFDVNPNTASCPSLDSGEGVHRNQEIKFIVSGPEHRGENPIETELSSMIGSAKKRVNIGNLLFNPAKPIAEALREVKKRNQQVKLVGHFNGKGPGSSLINYVNIWPSRPSYRLLDEVYESQALKQYYHRKVVTVDDEAAFVGSYNLGQKSSLCDYEVGCAIRSKGITKDINDALNGDKLGAKRIYTGPRWNDYSATVGFLAQSTLGNLAG